MYNENVMNKFITDVIEAMEIFDNRNEIFNENIYFWGIEGKDIILPAGSGIFKYKTRMMSSQYTNEIYWAKIKFSEKTIEKLNGQYMDVTGIHIMPYTITKNTIENAVNSMKKNFGIEIEKNQSYCDYDSRSGNFHKLPDGRYQVVLTVGGGPCFKEVSGDKSILRKVKTNYYFPNINCETNQKSYDSHYILKLVNDALAAIGISTQDDSK